MDETPATEFDHLTRYFQDTEDIAYTVLWDVAPPAATFLGGEEVPQAGPLEVLLQ